MLANLIGLSILDELSVDDLKTCCKQSLQCPILNSQQTPFSMLILSVFLYNLIFAVPFAQKLWEILVLCLLILCLLNEFKSASCFIESKAFSQSTKGKVNGYSVLFLNQLVYSYVNSSCLFPIGGILPITSRINAVGLYCDGDDVTFKILLALHIIGFLLGRGGIFAIISLAATKPCGKSHSVEVEFNKDLHVIIFM